MLPSPPFPLSPSAPVLSEPWMQVETGLVSRRIYVDPKPEISLNPWHQELADLMLNDKEREIWDKLPEKGPRRRDRLFGRIAAKDAVRQWAKQVLNLEIAPVDIEILSTELGKPFLRCPSLKVMVPLPDISISHSRGYVVAALGRSRLGIDLERLGNIRFEDWIDAAFSPSELELLPSANLLIALGFWCAKEAASKAVGTGLQGVPGKWAIASCSPDGKQVKVTHNNECFSVNIWYCDNEVLAICQC